MNKIPLKTPENIFEKLIWNVQVIFHNLGLILIVLVFILIILMFFIEMLHLLWNQFTQMTYSSSISHCLSTRNCMSIQFSNVANIFNLNKCCHNMWQMPRKVSIWHSAFLWWLIVQRNVTTFPCNFKFQSYTITPIYMYLTWKLHISRPHISIWDLILNQAISKK